MANIALCYFDVKTGYYPSFHHGLASIIGMLTSHGHGVTLFHITSESEMEQARDAIHCDRPSLVGLSFTTNQKKYAASFLSRLEYDGPVIAGGVHVTIVRSEIFTELPRIDGICIGEGETQFAELARRIDSGSDYTDIQSFIFKRDGQVIENGIAPLVELDTLPIPDYSMFKYEKIIRDNGDCFPMMLGRGCPFTCNYCVNQLYQQIYPNKKRYVRQPSIDRAIAIIRSNLALYPGVKRIMFNDDIFTLDKEWLRRFCKAYKAEIGLEFLCCARVETINDETAAHLKAGGCFSIDFGVESGNEWLRRHVLNRKHSNETIRKAFRAAQKHRINCFSFTMVGLPFETREMAKDSILLNMALKPNFGKCFFFYPFPGTELYSLCKKYNLYPDDPDRVSGFLESPIIKEVFMTHKEIKKYSNIMNAFFYAQLVLQKLRLTAVLHAVLLKIVFLLRKPVIFLADPYNKNRYMVLMRKLLRKFAMRHLR